jgi:hypothetical protein
LPVLVAGGFDLEFLSLRDPGNQLPGLPALMGGFEFYHISTAKRIASPTATILDADIEVINDPILPFETGCR